jgi:hypothetical protein
MARIKTWDDSGVKRNVSVYGAENGAYPTPQNSKI